MAAVGHKLELALVRRVVGNVGAIYRSPAMHEHRPDEGSREQVERTSSSPSEPWIDFSEAARGWGFVAVFGLSIYASFRLVSWLASLLFN